jgi:hypothetical protein
MAAGIAFVVHTDSPAAPLGFLEGGFLIELFVLESDLYPL